jgi:hypothetical protein
VSGMGKTALAFLGAFALCIILLAGCAGQDGAGAGGAGISAEEPGKGDLDNASMEAGTGGEGEGDGESSGQETGAGIEEEPEPLEASCIPSAGEGGSALIGIYKDYRYVNNEGAIVYGEISPNESVSSAYGPKFTLEGFRVNGGRCESCSSEPEGVRSVEAVFSASGLLDGKEPSEYLLEEGETIHFCSLYNCTQEGDAGECISGRCEREAHFHVWDIQLGITCARESQ